jgi:hypothetical protein
MIQYIRYAVLYYCTGSIFACAAAAGGEQDIIHPSPQIHLPPSHLTLAVLVGL